MALPQKGAWARRYQQPYSGASVWGTGIHGIHSVYGSPPSRLQGIRPLQGQITVPADAVPEQLQPKQLWGYQLEDSLYSDLTVDGRPPWNRPPEDSPAQFMSDQIPPMNASGGFNNKFRAIKGGAFTIWQYVNGMKLQPSETVSEGWRNKPKGSPADAKPSDPKQYEMQTSVQQRYRNRNNQHAVARGADEPRADIASRVIGQRLKVYSGGLRHYDMFPY